MGQAAKRQWKRAKTKKAMAPLLAQFEKTKPTKSEREMRM